MKPKLIIVVGPTASGKSDLGVELARKLDGEIISADSRQVYRGMNIGTGKVTKKEMRGIRHHLLDVASPRRTYTAADFKKDAERAIRGILRRGKLPIIVGGTGFYIDSLLYDSPIPDVQPNAELRADLEKLPAERLFEMLKKKDPVRAENIDRHNKRRLIRALEIIKTTGKPVPPRSASFSRILSELGIAESDVMKIGISRPAEELRKRIHVRLLSRMRKGMLSEVRKLHASGVSWKRLDELGLEYRFLSRHLRGLISKEEMLQKLESEIWDYARRQMTWWRKDKDITWTEDPREVPSYSQE